MSVITKLLFKIILNFLLIGHNFNKYNCVAFNYSDSGFITDKINFYNKPNYIYDGDMNKNIEKSSFKPIYIYSTALINLESLKSSNRNELNQKQLNAPGNNLTAINANQLTGKYNIASVRNNNSDTVLENIDTLIRVLVNDNSTVTSLLWEYFFDYDNGITSVIDYSNNANDSEINYFTVYDVQEQSEGRQRNAGRDGQRGTKHIKVKKKYKKYMLPLLLAYKLKFFALIPIMISGLVLLTGSTGLAGFFFALFAAVMGLKSKHRSQY